MRLLPDKALLDCNFKNPIVDRFRILSKHTKNIRNISIYIPHSFIFPLYVCIYDQDVYVLKWSAGNMEEELFLLFL